MFYSQVVPNCWIYWGSSLSEMTKMFTQRSTSLEMRGQMFVQLNPPRASRCVYHSCQGDLPSLGKQHRGYSTEHFQFSSPNLLAVCFFTFLCLKDFFWGILHFVRFVLHLHSHRDLEKKTTATLATVLSSWQTAALINQYSKFTVYFPTASLPLCTTQSTTKYWISWV